MNQGEILLRAREIASLPLRFENIGYSSMIACKHLFRINLISSKASNTCGKLKSPCYFQKYSSIRGLSSELKMDDEKGKRPDIDRKIGKKVPRTWRAVSTQSTSRGGDGKGRESQSRSKDMHHASSSTVSTVERGHTDSKKHSISMEIGCSLMRFVKGKGGGTQDEIEKVTGVKIIFPSSRKEDSIIIEGNSAESVSKASAKIQIIIDKAVNSRDLDYSHFVSLPLTLHPGLVDKLVDFQNNILGISTRPTQSKTPASGSSSSNLRELGIEKSIFIKPRTFHLTVLMLKLWNKDRVKAAAEILESVSSKVMDALDGRPVSIKLKGLDLMRGSWAKARVVYAPVEEIGGEGRLLRACQVIIDAFTEAGFVIEKDARQKLKLHATVMNAGYRKRDKNTRNLDSFDARGIFDQYGTEEWGEYPLREAHLSQRFVYDESGYYHCCASITFPDNKKQDCKII